MSSLPVGSTEVPNYSLSGGEFYIYTYETATGYGSQLYIYNGTADIATLLIDLSGDLIIVGNPFGTTFDDDGTNFAKINNIILFETEKNCVYATNGTIAGTELLAPFAGEGAVTVLEEGQVGNHLLLIAQNSQTGSTGLYSTDGTNSGTMLLVNFTNGAHLQNIGGNTLGNILFVAECNEYTQMYSTGGTVAGTQLLLQIPEVDAISEIGGIGSYTLIATPNAIYSTDETLAGTQVIAQGSLAEGPTYFHSVDGRAFFVTSPSGGAELYGTDGTLSGTQLIVSCTEYAEFAAVGTAIGNNVLIANSIGQVYATNGTTSGTTLLIDLPSSETTTSGTASLLVQVSDDILFSEVQEFASGNTMEIYASDGSVVGTQLLISLEAVVGTEVLTSFDGVTVFQVSQSPASGSSGYTTVYGTNGTAAGTHELFNAGAGTVTYINSGGGGAFFAVTNTLGITLYNFNLRNNAASIVTTAPLGSTFSVADNGTKTTVETLSAGVVAQRSWVGDASGATTQAGDEYIWIGSGSGNWSTASNWEDTTLGANPATVPPSSGDSVTFESGSNSFQVINGIGASSYLTLDGENAISGQLTTGVLTVNGTLEIENSGMVTVTAVNNAIGGTIINNGSFDDAASSGTVAVQEASFTNDGTLTIVAQATLDITGAISGIGLIQIDANAIAELGGATAAGQTVTFNNTDGVLKLDASVSFSGDISGFSAGDSIDLTALTFMSSYEAAWNSGTGVLKIVDTANGNAVVETLDVTGHLSDGLVTLASDGASGMEISVTPETFIDVSSGDVLVSDIPGQAYSAYEKVYANGVYTSLDYIFTNVSGQAYSAYETIYSPTKVYEGTTDIFTVVPAGAPYAYYETDDNNAGSFTGAQYFITNVTGEAYTGEEVSYDATGKLASVLFTGVTGAAYSSYQENYVGGVYAGTDYTVTSVPSGASYSSYQLDYNGSNVFTGEVVFFASVTGEPFTQEELDFDASGNLSRFVANGVTGQTYSSYANCSEKRDPGESSPRRRPRRGGHVCGLRRVHGTRLRDRRHWRGQTGCPRINRYVSGGAAVEEGGADKAPERLTEAEVASLKGSGCPCPPEGEPRGADGSKRSSISGKWPLDTRGGGCQDRGYPVPGRPDRKVHRMRRMREEMRSR